ncbi:hypothetical protein [Cryptosporangium arvum]|uniref:Uncharacterized protein n=1 Tax=Cryptosporangium arvum DSM 44712 TaxID=927661 RepID=A0A010YZL4_9ACTN|nr:hypothetical protein [Cryptosporangium arvum]EXG80648.1 hypothetical protein CryarDRAFT_1732 [Cryptosporangium arvum DSM 44712]
MLYARSRRVPMALGAAAAGTFLSWLIASTTSDQDPVGSTALLLAVLLLIAIATATLGGPDASLDRTAARPWARLRASHLIVVLGCVTLLLQATEVTGTRFGPIGFVVRNAGGLLGLTALGAAAVGAARAWILPLGWTLLAATFPGHGRVGEALTWQIQSPGSRPATVVAAVLGLAGLVAYTLRGPRPGTSPENP